MASPHHSDGPFVQDSRGPGLLRRLLGGGTSDPTAPHTHQEASTSDMHDRVPSPVKSVTIFSAIGWIVRKLGLRLTFAAVAGLLVLLGSFNDGIDQVRDAADGFSEIQQFGSTAPDAGTPVYPEDLSASELRVSIQSVRGDEVVLGMAGATTLTWKIDSPSVYAALTRNIGEEAVVQWEVRGADIVVVGVDGPSGTFEAPAEAA